MKRVYHKQKRKRTKTSIQKPKGSRFTEEVKQLGPEKVGVISIDVHKDKHEVIICDYYGKILKDEFEIPNTLTGAQILLVHISEVIDKFKLKKVYAVMEYTGNYHKNLAKRLRQAKITVTFVLPNSTYHLRQGQLNWCKTDSIDLCAIGQAFINGWVSSSPPLDNFYENWQTLTRARRNEVHLQTQTKNRISDLSHELMPGFMELFGNFYQHNAPPAILQLTHSPEELLKLNRKSLIQKLIKAKVQKPADLVDKLLIWAKTSIVTSNDSPGKVQQFKVEWQRLLDCKENIRAYNLQVAQYLAKNPALLLLSIPWVNVPSAGEYASEVGPYDNFSSPKQITAYFGLAPKKFQTGKVSFEDGPITKKGKSHGRAGVMNIANNLVQGNDYYVPNYLSLRARGKVKQCAKVAIANKFIRNSFRMIETGQLFDPPAWTGKKLFDDPISKLKDFLHANTDDKDSIIAILNQAQKTLDTVVKKKSPDQQKETEVQTKQEDTQIPQVIHQQPKLESVATEVVFSRVDPLNYKGAVPIGDVLKSMIISGKLPPQMLGGRTSNHA